MHNLSDYNELKSLLARHGFSFSKSLGQNFIIDPDICPFMAESAVPDSSYGVLEIGPGIGVLTAELALRAAKVVSVELDTRLLPILSETLAEFDNIKILNEDILKLDVAKVIAEEFPNMPVTVCANLPYYITSPVIMKLLQSKLPIEALTVMVQAEAADRLCAKVGTRAAGAVTVAVDYYAQAEELLFVPRDSFMPAPKVDSKIIQLTVRENPSGVFDDEDDFFNMIKAAFSKRRKTIMNSLTQSAADKENLSAVLKELDIPQTARIEQLSFQNLTDIYHALHS